MTNYYHVLGLTEDATPEEIKSAFKRLAVKYHPDKHPGRPEMEEKFKEINTAHQILSDEYEKARFDLKLKYQQFSQTQTRPYTYQPPSADSWKNQSRRRYQYRQVDYRQNAIATAYAFGITFLIALVVMTGIWIKRSYDDYQLEKLLADRRSSYETAKMHFESGDYRMAFKIMTGLRFFRSEEQDMKVFKKTMLDQIEEKGNVAFRSEQYVKAITLYELIQEFAPNRPYFELKKKLSESYRHNDQPQEAIKILEEFLDSEFEIIRSLVKIAEIQRDDLGDLNLALEQLLAGHRVASKRYKRFYGEGYALVINENDLPSSHFYLYTNLADVYYRLEDYEMAIKAADWNKYVWPDSAISYVTTALAYESLGQNNNACIEWSGARDRDWSGTSPNYCR